MFGIGLNFRCKLSKRALAVKAGAVEADRETLVSLMRSRPGHPRSTLRTRKGTP